MKKIQKHEEVIVMGARFLRVLLSSYFRGRQNDDFAFLDTSMAASRSLQYSNLICLSVFEAMLSMTRASSFENAVMTELSFAVILNELFQMGLMPW